MSLSDDQFFAQRDLLFQDSPVDPFDLEQTRERLRDVCRRKPSAFDVLAQALGLLVQPRCGVSGHEEMRHLLRFLEDHGGPDILTITIDSYTRLNLYDQARQQTCLNGYPLVTRGVECGRDLVECVGRPLEVRHGSPDGRLLAEVSFASGVTSFEGGGISYNLPYCKNVPLEHSLRHWQYIDRLTGLLSRDVILDRETFGTLTAVLMPPSVSIAVSILEVQLAVEQGVRCVTVSYPETGCLTRTSPPCGSSLNCARSTSPSWDCPPRRGCSRPCISGWGCSPPTPPRRRR
jgi:methylaspartate mutase epsilon subunit